MYADLRFAYFYKADLSGANFTGSDLFGADLRKSYLFRSIFYGAKSLPLLKSEIIRLGVFADLYGRNNNIIESDKPVLSCSLKISKDKIIASDKQTITIQVVDKTDETKIIRTTIRGEVKYLSAKEASSDRVMLQPSTTNSRNEISYSWIIPKTVQSGKCIISIYGYAKGYEPFRDHVSFEVIND